MKTFADLKRDLVVGKTLTMTYSSFEKNKLLNKPRKIIKVQTNGVYLETEGTKRGSFLAFPCASLTEYDGKTIKFYRVGKRPLTAQEKALIDNEPSRRLENKQLVKNDLLSDGSTTYYMDKKYYMENNANWRWDYYKGLRLNFYEMNMYDNKIKGNLDLQYTIE